MSIFKNLGYVAALGLLSVVSVSPSYAQQRVDQKSLGKATWHESPREIQILDERPVIRDFREAPAAAQSIELPPAPQGFGGAGGGGGSGALGGGAPLLPAGGVPIAGNGPGYRSAPANALPKSGFNGPSNIPARGMAPAGSLPGVTKGVLGNIMAKPKGNGAGAGPAGGMAPPQGRSNGNYNGPAVSSYGGYGTGSGTGTGSASSTESNVHGKLLRH
ncbi:MAG TPA: hypothetical protein V6C97_25860 [Oculatellaceae cyanobacterium]